MMKYRTSATIPSQDGAYQKFFNLVFHPGRESLVRQLKAMLESKSVVVQSQAEQLREEQKGQ